MFSSFQKTLILINNVDNYRLVLNGKYFPIWNFKECVAQYSITQLFWVRETPKIKFKRISQILKNNTDYRLTMLMNFFIQAQGSKLCMKKPKSSNKCGFGELKLVPPGCEIWRNWNSCKSSEKVIALLKFILYTRLHFIYTEC